MSTSRAFGFCAGLGSEPLPIANPPIASTPHTRSYPLTHLPQHRLSNGLHHSDASVSRHDLVDRRMKLTGHKCKKGGLHAQVDCLLVGP